MTPRRTAPPQTDPSPPSTEFGEIPRSLFLRLWDHDGVVRFRYRPIRVVPVLFGLVLFALWSYYIYSLFVSLGFSLALVVFGLMLLAGTALVALRVMRWRLFVKRSGVIVTDKSLLWCRDGRAYLAPWHLIDPDTLGLERLSFGGSSGYDTYLTIGVGDHAEPLHLVRLYARLERREEFLAELLRHIPRERWTPRDRG